MLSGNRDSIELNAPKGMARVGDELWVTDIDRLRRFVLPLGDPSPDVLLPGATFANDLAADGRGGAWVSDTAMEGGTPAVWHVDWEGQARRRIEGALLGQPNGLLRRGEGLLIARWDEVEGGGAILQWSPEGGLMPWARLPSAGLDGLVALPTGRIAVTSWGCSCLYLLSPEGQLLETRSLFRGPADLELDPDGQRLWVPAFLDGDLRAVPL
jgi:sugar lactone lactonase YvrE